MSYIMLSSSVQYLHPCTLLSSANIRTASFALIFAYFTRISMQNQLFQRLLLDYFSSHFNSIRAQPGFVFAFDRNKRNGFLPRRRNVFVIMAGIALRRCYPFQLRLRWARHMLFVKFYLMVTPRQMYEAYFIGSIHNIKANIIYTIHHFIKS